MHFFLQKALFFSKSAFFAFFFFLENCCARTELCQSRSLRKTCVQICSNSRGNGLGLNILPTEKQIMSSVVYSEFVFELQ